MGQRRRSRVLNVIGGLSLGAWVLANSVLWYHYAQTRPHEANPATGHTHALNTHGSVVYLTLGDWFVLYGTLTAAWVGGASVIAVTLRRKGWTPSVDRNG